MGCADYGYVVCPSCHGEFHRDNMRPSGKCWLCDEGSGPLVEELTGDDARWDLTNEQLEELG